MNEERKLEWALWLACKELSKVTGSCPYDLYDVKPCDCEEMCGDTDTIPECWVSYFKSQVVEE